MTHTRFVGEPLRPLDASFDTARMAVAEPGLPLRFEWRGETVEVRAVLRSWRSTGRCRHGSPERYVRRHWYRVHTRRHGMLVLYFDRNPRPGGDRRRWWVFSRSDAWEG